MSLDVLQQQERALQQRHSDLYKCDHVTLTIDRADGGFVVTVDHNKRHIAADDTNLKGVLVRLIDGWLMQPRPDDSYERIDADARVLNQTYRITGDTESTKWLAP